MTKKVAIAEMEIKGFGAVAMEELKRIINGWPVGASHEISVGKKLDGTILSEKHKKISVTHIEIKECQYY